ncbi:hypothetical protein B0H16DRAFT_1484434 [Mycena metata]|uniref:Uncharacterized protein n=1 Tax=Mycena metata TaxID=1033252 RepID=A0AAD7GJW1_9AGAR|nr:hypothetical protein B0H16DRAFT_1484434 [Mycena metata]
MFSHCNHHDQWAPTDLPVPAAPSTTPIPAGQPKDLLSAHYHRLESLLDSALATLMIILDTAHTPTFTDHTSQVLQALARRTPMPLPCPPTLTPSPTPPPDASPSTPTKVRAATYVQAVAEDHVQPPNTEPISIMAVETKVEGVHEQIAMLSVPPPCRPPPDLIFRFNLNTDAPQIHPHPSVLFAALNEPISAAGLLLDGIQWTQIGNLTLHFMHSPAFTPDSPLLRLSKQHPPPRVDHGDRWHSVVVHNVPVPLMRTKPDFDDGIGGVAEWLHRGGFNGTMEGIKVLVNESDGSPPKKQVPLRISVASKGDADFLVKNGALIFGRLGTIGIKWLCWRIKNYLLLHVPANLVNDLHVFKLAGLELGKAMKRRLKEEGTPPDSEKDHSTESGSAKGP